MVMANARLSERSVRHFKHMSGLIEKILQSVTWIGAQSAEDANRLVKCGANQQRVDMTGNLKFDLNIPARLVPPMRNALSLIPSVNR
jgi:3-deoxy-D-manno-octulosonic-acid transferase